MLHNFLTDEEKAKLRQDSQQYREWRQSIDAVVGEVEPEESILKNSANNYHRGTESTEGNENAGENPVRNSRVGLATTKAPEGKLNLKNRWNNTPEIPEISIGERPSSDQLVRGSSFRWGSSSEKRPVTFFPSAGMETGEIQETEESNRDSERATEARLSTATIRSSRTRKAKRVLSVDEIVAKAIREWRREQDSPNPHLSTGKHVSTRGSRTGMDLGVTERDNYSVRKEMECEIEEKKYDAEKSATSLECSDSNSNSSDYDDFDETETEESSSTMTEEQIHRRKVQRNLDIATDIFKVTVFFCIACGLTLLPIAFLEHDNLPKVVTFNITEHNICYWHGSKGFLYPHNPCPYRGYIGNEKGGKECLRWKDAIEGGNGLNGVGIDKIHFRDNDFFRFLKDDIKDWQKLYHERDSLPPKKRELVTDYEHRFCRRLGSDPETNLAVCLTLGPKGEDALDEIYVSDCWIVPCSIKVASACYQKQVDASEEAEK